MRLAGLLDDGRVHSSRPRERRSVPHFGWWLTLIAVAALILRIVVVLKGRSEWVAGDGFGYSLQANQMAHGRLFVQPFDGHPFALHPPAWVVLLTAVAWLGGHTWLPQQLVGCAIGTATVTLVGLAGRRIGGDRAGLVAAGIAAVYAGLWVYERALLSETLLLPLIALMILAAYRFRDGPSAALATLLGALCGLLALTRSEQILLLPLLVLPLIVTSKEIAWRRRLGWLALATAVTLALLAPWAIYNQGRFQHPVVLSTGLGLAAAQANCDSSYYGPHTGWGEFRCALNGHASQSSDASVADIQDRHLALSYAEHHLDRAPIVLVAREGRTFGFWAPLQQTALDSQYRSAFPAAFANVPHPSDLWVGRVALFSLWLLLIPAVAGAVELRRRSVPIYPLLVLVATIVVAVAVTFGDERYRAGAEISIVLLAAIGIDAALRRRPPASVAKGQLGEESCAPDPTSPPRPVTGAHADARLPEGEPAPAIDGSASSQILGTRQRSALDRKRSAVCEPHD